jgi:hypothetical protein
VRLEYRFAGLIPVHSEINLKNARILPHRNYGKREERGERYDFGLLFSRSKNTKGGIPYNGTFSPLFPLEKYEWRDPVQRDFLEKQKESGHEAR